MVLTPTTLVQGIYKLYDKHHLGPRIVGPCDRESKLGPQEETDYPYIYCYAEDASMCPGTEWHWNGIVVLVVGLMLFI